MTSIRAWAALAAMAFGTLGACYAPAAAATLPWKKLAGFGGCVPFAMVDTGVAGGIAASCTAALYRSTNAGASWVPASGLPSPSNLTAFAAGLAAPSPALYVIDNGKAYSSIGGDAWQGPFTPSSVTPGNNLVASPVVAGEIYNPGYTVLGFSWTYGFTYTAVPFFNHNNLVTLAASRHAGWLYASDQAYLYRSQDNGNDFAVLPALPLMHNVQSVVTASLAPEALLVTGIADGATVGGGWRSIDGGNSFQPVAALAAPAAYTSWSLAVPGRGPQIIAQALPNLLQLSPDAGADWISIAAPAGSSGAVQYFALTGFVFAVDSTGAVFRLAYAAVP